MRQLKEFVTEYSVRNKDVAFRRVFSVTNSSGFMPSTDYFNKEVFSKDLSTYKIVKPGMLAYNPSRINVGSVDCLHLDSPVIVSPLYVVIQVDDSHLLPEYLNIFLHSDIALRQIKALTSGSVRDSLKFSAFSKLQIPIPSIENQKEIIAHLERIRTVILHRELQCNKLDQLAKSRFIEMFGAPDSNPQQWLCKTMKEVSLRLSDGPFGSNLKSDHYSEEGIRVIRLQNIGVNEFIDKDKAFVSAQHYEKIKKYTCQAGDIVIGTLGEPNLRACLIPESIPIAINKADCVHYIPDERILNKIFVCGYLNMPETLALASGMIHGQTRARISSGQIAKLRIYLPPLALQNEFAAFVEQLDKSKLADQTDGVAA